MLDVVAVDVLLLLLKFSIRAAELVSTIGALVIGIVLATDVDISGIADGFIAGDGSGGDGGGGTIDDDDCSGNGANGMVGANGGGLTLLTGACATVGCSLLAIGTATVGVIGCPLAATATGFKGSFKNIARIRSFN